ncbi:hypothetical protein BG015_008380 [Linnemannia schmuckeri]|uniref:F-box domain-containing protein n=1 Tax=Linnemannia schmuckeri TaxID=64567 RepID=A0A9P5VAJ6_9FUNG|nr:hypothetical protein BG015_008380 [Linnemannia schmuckeri]
MMTLAPRPSPLNIPELLHRIFYFFDDYELTRHVLPVCRLWFLLHQHHIAREIHFDETLPTEEVEQVLLGLPWATRLCWSGGMIKNAARIQQRRYRRQMMSALREKFDDFMDNRFLRFRPVTGDGKIVGNRQYIGEGGFYTYGSGGLDGLVQGSKAPLRELLVSGSMDYEGRVAPLLPFLSTLQRLELRLGSGYLDLCGLLRATPSLEALDIRGNCTINGDLGGAHFTKHRGGQPLLLRSIIFGKVRYPQASVETMLTMTPHLQELKLFDVSMENYSFYGATVQISPPQLLAHIRSLSLPLERLYISIREEHMPPEFLSAQLDICPLKDEFFSWDFPREVMQIIQQTPNIITTLELTAPGKCGLESTLHQYLCSSPHLLHLLAPKIEYLVNHMDIHRRLSDTNTSRFNDAPASGQPRIWACSNLATLHLGIHSIGGETPQDPSFKEQGRVLFGYISRVTPRLRDLHLSLSRYLTTKVEQPRLCLDSGLCLLARLTRLETLRIGGELSRQVAAPEDVEWMLQSGHSLEMRARRWAVVASWDAQIEEEARKQDVLQQERQQQDNVQQQQQNGDDQQQQQNGYHQQQQQQTPIIPIALAEQLQDLGRLADVKKMVEEIDSKSGFSYWPELKRVSLFSDSEFGFSVERECQRELARLARAETNS